MSSGCGVCSCIKSNIGAELIPHFELMQGFAAGYLARKMDLDAGEVLCGKHEPLISSWIALARLLRADAQSVAGEKGKEREEENH